MSGETEWYSGKRFVPGTPGVYQRSVNGQVRHSKWTGTCWGLLTLTAHDADNVLQRSSFQDLPFRGLTTKGAKQ